MLRYELQPSKELNISSLQIALLNYTTANIKSCNFLIRVDDLTKEFIEGQEQESLDILKKFAINIEQKVYKKDNLSIYQRFATKLIEDNKAYICFCSKDRDKSCNCPNLNKSEIKKKLDKKQPYSIVLKKAKIDNLSLNEELEIVTKDSNPTELFSSAIDDMISSITTIIDDKDELQNSIKQKLIHKLLNYNQDIEYISIEMNYKPITIKELLKEGFLPDAIINYLFLLIHPAPKDIFYLPDAIEWFDLDKLYSKSKEFNLNELQELNRKHLLKMDSKKLSSVVGFADSDIGELLKIFLKEAYTINELQDRFKKIFSEKESKGANKDSIKLISDIIKKAPVIDSFSDFVDYISKTSNLNREDTLKHLSYLITGEDSSRYLEDIYLLIKPYILEVARCQ